MLDDISTDRESLSNADKNINKSEDLVSTKMALSGEIFDSKDVMYTPPLTKVEKQQLDDKKKSSDFQCFMNVLKLNFGNAYLSIPNVFMLAGIGGGLLLFAVVGCLNLVTMQQNLDVAEKHPRLHSYSELGMKLFGKRGKFAVDLSIWIMQLSTCISYIYFIAQQLDEQFCFYNGYCDHQDLWMVILTVPALSISMFQTFTFLSYVAMVGITIAVIGMVSMFGYCGEHISSGKVVDAPLMWFNVKAIFGHIGVAMFTFEGNACIINVRAEAKNQDRFSKILVAGILTTVTLFMIFGLVGYLTYRDTTESILTLNFQPITGFVTFIIVCVCLNCFTSYPIQILAAFDIMEQADFFKRGHKKCRRIGVRTIIIVMVTFIATLIPNFTDFLNIAGSLGASIIGFVLPPIFYNEQFKETISTRYKIFNYFIVGFGAIGGIISITTSIIAMTNGTDE